MPTAATYEEAKQRIHELLHDCFQAPTTKRHQPSCSYQVEEVLPRSYLIGAAVFREVESLIDWMIEHPKRSTIPRERIESFLRRVVDILPHELKALQLMDDRV